MKKFMLAVVAFTVVATAVSTAEAGRWGYYHPVVRYGWGPPVGPFLGPPVGPIMGPPFRPFIGPPVPPVVLAPRYYRPAYVARPYYYSPYRYGYIAPPPVYMGGPYGGGAVIVRTPGFGLNIQY